MSMDDVPTGTIFEGGEGRADKILMSLDWGEWRLYEAVAMPDCGHDNWATLLESGQIAVHVCLTCHYQSLCLDGSAVAVNDSLCRRLHT